MFSCTDWFAIEVQSQGFWLRLMAMLSVGFFIEAALGDTGAFSCSIAVGTVSYLAGRIWM
jgi:hypothetical protein